MGHMIFKMLKKKSLTNHLLLTDPTAVFLNNDRSCISYTSVSGFSQCLLVLCKTCRPDVNAFTSCSLPFTGKRLEFPECEIFCESLGFLLD